jgi:hypothetical protein
MTRTGAILLPTAYFPPVSWFAQMIQSHTVFIELEETFPKQTYRNRCEIMTASGKDKLIVPVTKPQGNHTITRKIDICFREPWQDQHWKTLQSAYSSSPYYSFYADLIQPLFESRETSLVTYNHNIIKTICSLIGINPSVGFTKEYIKEQDGLSDLRAKFSPKSTSLVIEFPRYPQVFEHTYGFLPNLSILDLLFNLGPDANLYLAGILHS